MQERDLLGDDLVPDYFTHIQQGGFYGWPYAYIGPHEDPRRKGEKPDLVAKTIVPDLVLPAHVAILDFLFYTGTQFPPNIAAAPFSRGTGPGTGQSVWARRLRFFLSRTASPPRTSPATS